MEDTANNLPLLLLFLQQNWDPFCVLVEYADTICCETHIWNFQRVFKTSLYNISFQKNIKCLKVSDDDDDDNWMSRNQSTVIMMMIVMVEMGEWWQFDFRESINNSNYVNDGDNNNNNDFDDGQWWQLNVQESINSPLVPTILQLQIPQNCVKRNREMGKRKCFANWVLTEKMATHFVGTPYENENMRSLSRQVCS